MRGPPLQFCNNHRRELTSHKGIFSPKGRSGFQMMDEDIEQMTFNLRDAQPVVINFKNLSFSPPKKKLFWKKNQEDSAIIDVRIVFCLFLSFPE